MTKHCFTAAMFAIGCLCVGVPAANAQQAGDQVFDENADLPSANPDIEQQMKGKFPAMERGAPVPLGSIQKAWEKSPATAGIYKVKWSHDAVTKITLREAMTTTIRLPEWEKIDRVVLGDTRIFRAAQINDNTETVWAVNPGSDTSLTIIGESSNIYVFYLHSETWNSDNIPDLTVIIDAVQPAIAEPEDGIGTSGGGGPVSITGPNSGANIHLASLTGGKPGKPEWLKGIPYDPSRIRRDLALYGDSELAPDDVFRDNQFTYLCYGERWDDGDLMVATPSVVTNDTDRPVNFQIKNGCMIIEATGQLSLKHGNSVLCIKPDPEMQTPRLSAAAERVRRLKPSDPAPSAAHQPVATASPSSPLPPVGPIAVQELPGAAVNQQAPDWTPKPTTIPDKQSGR